MVGERIREGVTRTVDNGWHCSPDLQPNLALRAPLFLTRFSQGYVVSFLKVGDFYDLVACKALRIQIVGPSVFA